MTLHDSFGGAYSYLRNIRSRKMTTIQIPLAEYEKLKADAERLDYLDTLTKRRLKTGRKLWPIASDMHFGASGVALYVRTGIGSKTETQGVGNTVRAAIDAAIKQEGGA
jgi:hypothetical protein